jgi:hypothetical protein
MPRAKKNPDQNSSSEPRQPRKPADNAEWGGFINVAMSEEEKTAARSWIMAFTGEVDSYLSDAVWEGLKLSVSADVSNECFIATFTGLPYEGSKLRSSLSARGATMWEATALLVYKHYVLAEGNWGQFMSSGKKKDNFG